jgi:hypothetical protein
MSIEMEIKINVERGCKGREQYEAMSPETAL